MQYGPPKGGDALSGGEQNFPPGSPRTSIPLHRRCIKGGARAAPWRFVNAHGPSAGLLNEDRLAGRAPLAERAPVGASVERAFLRPADSLGEWHGGAGGLGHIALVVAGGAANREAGAGRS